MCTNPLPAAGVPDVHALLEAAPGLEVMAALVLIDPFMLAEADRLVLVEVWDKQQAWVAAQAVTPLVAVAGDSAVDSDDFIRDDVRAALHLSRQAAHDRIDVARALSSTLVETRDALEAGGISYPQVRALVEAVRERSTPTALAVQAAVLGRAPDLTVGEFRRVVARAVLAADPQTLEEQHAVAAAGRSVVMYPAPAGMAIIRAELPAADARTIFLAADARARADDARARAVGGFDGPGADDRSIDARRADALTGLCAEALADPALPGSTDDPCTSRSSSTRRPSSGSPSTPQSSSDTAPSPPSVARALAADATWQRLVVEPTTGHLLDAGTTRYRPTRDLTEFILTRDRTCTFPTCHTPAAACDIDHAVPFQHQPHEPGGGGTSADNCRPACRRHHRLKTHGGWTVETDKDGSTTWINPTGRPYHSPATDHRPNSS